MDRRRHRATKARCGRLLSPEPWRPLLLRQRCEGEARRWPDIHGGAFATRRRCPLRWREGRTVGTGGRFIFNDETSGLLLASLPPLIHVRGGLPQARALRSALDLIAFETEVARPGGTAIAAGLCSIVLVNILRTYLAGDERPRGWLGALADPQIGAALRLMHGNVARRWKVSDLANDVGMSRTSFAERFKNLVGMAPLEYLTHWRMTIARNALKRDNANLATIAETIGYESDTAFSLAFKRMFGSSPGRYRMRMQRLDMAA
jgi:AraC-like DNA-binding protein